MFENDYRFGIRLSTMGFSSNLMTLKFSGRSSVTIDCIKLEDTSNNRSVFNSLNGCIEIRMFSRAIISFIDLNRAGSIHKLSL